MQKGQIRIIGGQWRGRKLHFPALAGLRPTPNRIRETLFNWLAPYIADAHCLDLFAGSGALGFEALSRQAKSVTFVEQSLGLIHYLKNQIKQFDIADKTEVYHARFPFSSAQVFKTPKKFNLIFLDPPFQQNMVAIACAWLLTENLLADNSLIYIETESSVSNLALPKNFCFLHHKIAGQVRYGLIKISPASTF